MLLQSRINGGLLALYVTCVLATLIIVGIAVFKPRDQKERINLREEAERMDMVSRCQMLNCSAEDSVLSFMCFFLCQVRARIRRHRKYVREQKYGDEPEQLDMDLSGGNKFLEVISIFVKTSPCYLTLCHLLALRW